MSPAPSTLGGLFGGPDEEGPVVTEATKEALRMVFHKNGSFAQVGGQEGCVVILCR